MLVETDISYQHTVYYSSVTFLLYQCLSTDLSIFLAVFNEEVFYSISNDVHTEKNVFAYLSVSSNTVFIFSLSETTLMPPMRFLLKFNTFRISYMKFRSDMLVLYSLSPVS